jgi:hypothetical protein
MKLIVLTAERKCCCEMKDGKFYCLFTKKTYDPVLLRCEVMQPGVD